MSKELEAIVALTDDEHEWLMYAIDHMLDDSEPEDRTCARVLQKLLDRCIVSTQAVEGWRDIATAPVGEVVESDAAGHAIKFPKGYAATLDGLPVGTLIYAGSPPSGDEAMALHWIDRYAAGIDDEPQMDRIRDALLPSPPSDTKGEG